MDIQALLYLIGFIVAIPIFIAIKNCGRKLRPINNITMETKIYKDSFVDKYIALATIRIYLDIYIIESSSFSFNKETKLWDVLIRYKV